MSSKSLKIMEKAFTYYLKKMDRLQRKGYEDDTAIDIENWYAAYVLLNEYKDGLIQKEDEFIEELLEYFGNKERTELVLSIFRIGKNLIDRGITLHC
ncbi:hypothetical protein [Tepidimicrobium xylanilyticum]